MLNIRTYTEIEIDNPNIFFDQMFAAWLNTFSKINSWTLTKQNKLIIIWNQFDIQILKELVELLK